MPDVSEPGGWHSRRPPLSAPTAARRGLKDRTAAEAALEPESPAAHRVGWGFISLYTLAYMSTSLLFLAPLLVTLALKVDSLVGIGRAPGSLALVAGTARADVPQQIFLGTLVQAAVVVAASLTGGKASDRTGRRKIFVLTASIVYGLAVFVIAIPRHFDGFLVGMAISGLGFGVYLAVDLALVVDVLPDKRSTAKDLGVFNIAGALPFSIAPAVAPAILAVGGGSYGVLYTVAGLCAIIGAVTILP